MVGIQGSSGQNHSFGERYLREITESKELDSEQAKQVKARVYKDGKAIYSLLSSSESKLECEEFQTAWMALCNDFQTLSHESHDELGMVEKLKLQCVIIDVTDDIKEAALQKMEMQKEGSAGGWIDTGVNVYNFMSDSIFGSSSKEYTLKEFFNDLTEYRESMEMPELTISLSSTKEKIDGLEKRSIFIPTFTSLQPTACSTKTAMISYSNKSGLPPTTLRIPKKAYAIES